MKCPECVALGQRSTVQDHGGSVTCMGFSSYYDEDGKRHSHDPNTRTMGYSCSNGHRWTERSSGSCWCGWKGTPYVPGHA